MHPGTPKLSLVDGFALSGLTYEELWLQQVSVGGVAGRLECEAYVLGLLMPDAHQYNVIAHTLNECLLEQGRPSSVGYWEAVRAS